MGTLRLAGLALLPPAAVFLVEGLSPVLGLSVLLSALGWLPGLGHALWVLSSG